MTTLFHEDEFWGGDFLTERSADSPVPPRPVTAPVRGGWLRAVAGAAVAATLVVQSAAASVNTAEIVRFISAVGESAVDVLDPSDLHDRAPDLQRLGRLIRALPTIESYDDYV